MFACFQITMLPTSLTHYCLFKIHTLKKYYRPRYRSCIALPQVKTEKSVLEVEDREKKWPVSWTFLLFANSKEIWVRQLNNSVASQKCKGLAAVFSCFFPCLLKRRNNPLIAKVVTNFDTLARILRASDKLSVNLSTCVSVFTFSRLFFFNSQLITLRPIYILQRMWMCLRLFFTLSKVRIYIHFISS